MSIRDCTSKTLSLNRTLVKHKRNIQEIHDVKIMDKIMTIDRLILLFSHTKVEALVVYHMILCYNIVFPYDIIRYYNTISYDIVL